MMARAGATAASGLHAAEHRRLGRALSASRGTTGTWRQERLLDDLDLLCDRNLLGDLDLPLNLHGLQLGRRLDDFCHDGDFRDALFGAQDFAAADAGDVGYF